MDNLKKMTQNEPTFDFKLGDNTIDEGDVLSFDEAQEPSILTIDNSEEHMAFSMIDLDHPIIHWLLLNINDSNEVTSVPYHPPSPPTGPPHRYRLSLYRQGRNIRNPPRFNRNSRKEIEIYLSQFNLLEETIFLVFPKESDGCGEEICDLPSLKRPYIEPLVSTVNLSIDTNPRDIELLEEEGETVADLGETDDIGITKENIMLMTLEEMMRFATDHGLRVYPQFASQRNVILRWLNKK